MATTAQQFIGNDDLTLCYMQLLLVVGQLCEASGRKTKTFAVIKKIKKKYCKLVIHRLAVASKSTS